MYKGQITVLMGQTGAGKTTTLSMLTGFLPPSSGTAFVNGYDITKNVGEMRKSLGICPQYTTVFDELTVREHLYFFASIKGLTTHRVLEENQRFLELLDLQLYADTPVTKLSETIKRKLCVAVSLCGNPDIVMLDEPTLGMDPDTRRTLWTFLENHKKGRTILLCTRLTEEAEVLGDRIAILVAGQMQCCGSMSYLKKKYGDGYKLILTKNRDCDVRAVTNILKNTIPDVTVNYSGISEVCYTLPKKHSPKFEAALSELEENMSKLGVTNIGITWSGLDDILTKVSVEYEQTVIVKETRSTAVLWQKKAEVLDKIQLVRGFDLIRNQYKAMLIKRIHGGVWRMILLQIIIPIIYLLLSEAANVVNTALPMLQLATYIYKKPIVFIQRNGSEHLAHLYTNLLNKTSHHLVDDIFSTILELSAEAPHVTKSRYILGADLKNNQVTAWYNGDALHSSALSLSLVLNTLYQNFTNTSTFFEFVNYPLPFTLTGEVSYMTRFHIGPAHLIVFALIVSTSFMVYFYIKERLCKFKQLQLVSGLNIFVYWTSAFVFELAVSSVVLVTVMMIVFTGIRNFKGYTNGADFCKNDNNQTILFDM